MKAVRGLWDGSSKILCRSGCGVVIKGVDRNRWITISKIAVPLGIGSAMAAEFTSRSEMFHEVARNNCSFVADEARFDVEHIRHVFHSLCFSVAFPEHVFLGFLPAHSHAGFGIVALDHQQDKVWKTEYRHGVSVLKVMLLPGRRRKGDLGTCSWVGNRRTVVQNSSDDYSSMEQKRKSYSTEKTTKAKLSYAIGVMERKIWVGSRFAANKSSYMQWSKPHTA